MLHSLSSHNRAGGAHGLKGIGFSTMGGESNPDVIAPTIISVTIGADGDSVTVVFSEAITGGVDAWEGFTLDMGDGPEALTDGNPDGATISYLAPFTISSGETGTATYTQPGDGIQDTAGNLLATVTDIEVDNDSTVPPPIADDFDRADGALGAKWTDLIGSHVIVGNEAKSTVESYGKNVSVYNQAVGVTDHWVKFQHKFNGQATSAFLGIGLRLEGSSNPHYLIDFNTNSFFWSVYPDIASAVDRNVINGGGGTFTFPDEGYMGLTIVGTGAATTLRVWKNPPTDQPDAGGATWGAAAPYIEQLIDAGLSADTGTEVAICSFQNITVGTIDNFTAGPVL